MAILFFGRLVEAESPHVDDQMRLLSRYGMRPVWRDHNDVEAYLEARKVLEIDLSAHLHEPRRQHRRWRQPPGDTDTES
jgi:hypothetical protein